MNPADKERIFMEMSLRQMAPQIKAFLEQFSQFWSLPFYDLYLSGRYKEGLPLEDPKSAIIEVKNIRDARIEDALNSNALGLKKGTSENELMLQMFPLFMEEFKIASANWKCKVTDVFLIFRYVRSEQPGEADTVQLQLRNKVNKSQVKIIS